MDPADDSDDARRTEVETLTAIFPELRRPEDADSPFVFELEIPIELGRPLTVTFPPAGTAGALGDEREEAGTAAQAPPLDSLEVSHLPPISVLIRLPDGYPETCPPHMTLKMTPQWLGAETLSRLERDGPRLWEEMGRDMVAYTYIDHIQQGAEDVFGTIDAEGTLAVDSVHKLAVLDYDIKAKKAAFERETFECGICLDPKKGSSCHKMMDCGHIFCVRCLCDFYEDAIKTGELLTVRCLTPNCAKERTSKAPKDAAGRPTKKPKTFISPSELLQIGLSDETVKRYVALKYKTELESDKNTIYCPRQWCNGAARSKKHKKPQGLDFVEVSDDEDDTEVEEDSSLKKKKAVGKAKFNAADLLAVCDDCGFAFCSRCSQSWHGEFVRCTGKRTKEELTDEEKASLAYLELHTSPCPTCSAPAQKTHGCNHMICSRCDTHFCYLCSAWLDPSNPYKHYNQQSDGKVTSCYMRLWELEGGDGDDVGLGFGGGHGAPGQGPAPPAPADAQAAAAAEEEEEEEEEEMLVLPAEEEDSEDEESVLGDNGAANGNPPVDEPVPNERGPVVSREGPLVLRVMDGPALRPRGNDAATADPRPPRGDGRRGRGGRGGGNNRHPRGGARGGAAAGGRGGAAVGVRQGGRARQIEQQAERRARLLWRQQQEEAEMEEAEMERHQDWIEAGGLVWDEVAGLNPEQEAWIRRFVEMALEDNEDDMHGDSDDDDVNFMMR